MLVTNIIGDPLLEQSAKRFHLYLKKAGLDGRGEPVGRPRKPCKLKNTPSIVIIIIIIIIRVGKPEIVFIDKNYTPNANMADLSDGPGLVARKRG